jgi:hypothetical protein
MGKGMNGNGAIKKNEKIEKKYFVLGGCYFILLSIFIIQKLVDKRKEIVQTQPPKS